MHRFFYHRRSSSISPTFLLVTLAVAFCSAVIPHTLIAAVSTVGQVTPAPPAGGGNLAGTFLVGDTMFGSSDIDGGTPLNLTNGSATVGNTATGFGIATLTGFGSNLTTALANADLTIGSAGTGSVSVSNFAQITILDDLFLAANPGASGSLVIDGFGTIVNISDSVLVGQADAGVIEIYCRRTNAFRRHGHWPNRLR